MRRLLWSVGFVRDKEWAAGVGQKRRGVFGLLRTNLQDELVLAGEEHHWAGDAGDVLIRREALDTCGFEACAGEQVLLLMTESSDGDPGFRHDF